MTPPCTAPWSRATRRSPIPRTLALFLAALLGVASGAVEASPGPLAQLVQVAANTGSAAGGHVALRLGEQAYHYQVRDDGLLRLVRDDWTVFETRYAVLENRSLGLIRLDLAAADYDRVESRLRKLHAVDLGAHLAVVQIGLTNGEDGEGAVGGHLHPPHATQ